MVAHQGHEMKKNLEKLENEAFKVLCSMQFVSIEMFGGFTELKRTTMMEFIVDVCDIEGIHRYWFDDIHKYWLQGIIPLSNKFLFSVLEKKNLHDSFSHIKIFHFIKHYYIEAFSRLFMVLNILSLIKSYYSQWELNSCLSKINFFGC